MVRCVVVGVDGSGTSLAAARWAAAEAAARGVPLRLVTAVEPESGPRADAPGSAARLVVAQLVRSALDHIGRALPEVDAVAEQIEGPPARVLAEAGRDAELLVVAARGQGGFAGLRLGSVALAVAGAAPCPVALLPTPIPIPIPVPAARPESVPEVAVGVDARDPNQRALALAFDAALRRGARLRAVHAWHFPPPYDGAPLTVLEEDRGEWEDLEVQLLDDALRGWRNKFPGVDALSDVRLFGPADALVRASASADLLVVGRGDGQAPHLGGVAHAVAHHTRCPLLLAPPR